MTPADPLASELREHGLSADPASDKTEALLRALMVKLDGLAVTKGQREVMQALHRVAVVRMLRQAGSAVTIRMPPYVRLPVYEAEAALGWLCEQRAAKRDTTGRAWLYRAVTSLSPPAADEAPAASRPG